MRYTAAYLLAILGGNPSPDVAAIAKILDSVGIECDENRAQKVVDACKGLDVNESIARGMTQIDGALVNTPGPDLEIKPPVIPNPPLDSPPDSPPSRPESPPFGDLFG